MENVVAMNTKSLPGLKFNPDITVSIGNSRWSKDWKRRSWKWSALLARFAPENATRTPETQTEFFNMSKNEQDKIKDIGGFVGGEIQGSRRQAVNMKSRSLLTFDMDEAPTGFAETMRETYPDIAWAIYSTHKHTPEKPRLRLIIPLDHKVTPDEFEAVMRKMAQDIGMSYMDKSTFEPHRLMYWPSSSIDAEYVFEYNDAAPLDPDTILESYEGDWHDCSLWPMHPGEEKERREKTGTKQQNPLEKKGLIGVFCRTYTISEAIATFLPDIYKPVENDPTRYSYVEGSTSGGLAVYDDLFCYSFHATDPASGMELNAYDLVRLHKFGSLDEDAADNTPANRLPSTKAMSDLIRSDEKCLITYDTEREAQISSDYGDLEDTVEGPDPEGGEKKEKNWKAKLARNKDGSIASVYLNVKAILAKDKALSGIAYNEMMLAIVCKKGLPWDKKATGRRWRDADDSGMYEYLAETYGQEFKDMHIRHAIVNVAHKRAFNPVKEYLESLPEWDGIERAPRIFIDYFGAEDCEYTRVATEIWLLAAVHRIYRPGCKFDYTPVLTGVGGIGKSKSLAKLGGEWFTDDLCFEDMQKSKDGAEKIAGKWIIEIGEMKGMRSTEVESVKSFLTRQTDHYREAYGRHANDYPRSCVFVGTCNIDNFLRDETGNRRFWPIKCYTETDQTEGLTQDVIDQIWAEVMTTYELADGDPKLYLSPELEKEAEQRQSKALEVDARAGIIGEYLSRKLPEHWFLMNIEDRRMWLENNSEAEGEEERTEVCTYEIWCECLGYPERTFNSKESRPLTVILKSLGWVSAGRAKRMGPYGVQKIFTKPEDDILS